MPPSYSFDPCRVEALKARLLAKRRIVPETGCWIWTGRRNHQGYGRISVDGSDILARRLAFALWRETPLSRRQLVEASCNDNGCICPEHLQDTTSAAVVRRTVLAGKHPETRKTHCPRGHEYSETNTYRDRRGCRHCRACHSTHTATYHARLRAKQAAAAEPSQDIPERISSQPVTIKVAKPMREPSPAPVRKLEGRELLRVIAAKGEAKILFKMLGRSGETLHSIRELIAVDPVEHRTLLEFCRLHPFESVWIVDAIHFRELVMEEFDQLVKQRKYVDRVAAAEAEASRREALRAPTIPLLQELVVTATA